MCWHTVYSLILKCPIATTDTDIHTKIWWIPEVTQRSPFTLIQNLQQDTFLGYIVLFKHSVYFQCKAAQSSSKCTHTNILYLSGKTLRHVRILQCNMWQKIWLHKQVHLYGGWCWLDYSLLHCSALTVLLFASKLNVENTKMHLLIT